MTRRLIATGKIVAGHKTMFTGQYLKVDPHKVWPSTDNTPTGDYWRDSSYADHLQMTMDRQVDQAATKLGTFIAASMAAGMTTTVDMSRRDLQLTVLHGMARKEEP